MNLEVEDLLNLGREEAEEGKKKKKKKKRSRTEAEEMPPIDPLLQPFGDAAEEEMRKKLKKRMKKMKKEKKEKKKKKTKSPPPQRSSNSSSKPTRLESVPSTSLSGGIRSVVTAPPPGSFRKPLPPPPPPYDPYPPPPEELYPSYPHQPYYDYSGRRWQHEHDPYRMDAPAPPTPSIASSVKVVEKLPPPRGDRWPHDKFDPYAPPDYNRRNYSPPAPFPPSPPLRTGSRPPPAPSYDRSERPEREWRSSSTFRHSGRAPSPARSTCTDFGDYRNRDRDFTQAPYPVTNRGRPYDRRGGFSSYDTGRFGRGGQSGSRDYESENDDYRGGMDSRPSLPPSSSASKPRGGRGRQITGYGFHGDRDRSRSPIHRNPNDSSAPTLSSRPSPPKDMPEHIRWLHDRWRKYDKDFFKQGKTELKPADFSDTGIKTDNKPLEPVGGKRKFQEEESRGRNEAMQNLPQGVAQNPALARYAMPYYQFRKGGEYHWNPGRMLSFKEFLLQQSADIEDQEESVKLYNDYKLTFRQKALAEFFQAHSEDEWFLEKYHPILKTGKEQRRQAAVQKRLDVFMQLLVRGWMEVGLDVAQSRKVRKLMDAAIVLMEGGDEGDVGCLNDLDYVLEEKKEESYEVEKKEEEDVSEEEEVEEGKAPGKGRTLEEQKNDELDKELFHTNQKTAEELEVMQHARDYSHYVQERKDEAKKAEENDISLQPDNIEPVPKVVERTEYMGSGVFVSEPVRAKALEEMNLHKVSAVMLRNVPSSVPRLEIDEMCRAAHGGYLRLHMGEPDPLNQYKRSAIVSFWHNANMQKIMWKIRSSRLRGEQVVALEYREFKRRIDFIDGLSADKSVVLRDIQLCKSLIEYLDRRFHLWGDSSEGGTNPLMVNLDECLAFHLKELMDDSEDKTEPDISQPKSKVVQKEVGRDDNLTRVLDRLVLYLRIVHSIDYYGCKLYEAEDDEPNRIGVTHLRAEPGRKATPKALTSYIKRFEERLKCLLPQEKRIAEEHIELLGKRNAEEEVEKFQRANVLTVADGLSKCCLCHKRFTSYEFAQMHMRERHGDKLEEVKWVVVCFNNYLSDPQRPCSTDLSTGSAL